MIKSGDTDDSPARLVGQRDRSKDGGILEIAHQRAAVAGPAEQHRLHLGFCQVLPGEGDVVCLCATGWLEHNAFASWRHQENARIFQIEAGNALLKCRLAERREKYRFP